MTKVLLFLINLSAMVRVAHFASCKYPAPRRSTSLPPTAVFHNWAPLLWAFYADHMRKLFDNDHVRFHRIDGKVSMQDRTELLADFQSDPSLDAMLISTRAGGQGLNIQTANRVIIFDFGFNPAWEEQAIGRSYRFGQEKPVFVYIVPNGELRGGAWVVLDTSINAEGRMEMYADVDSRGGVLEPEGIVEIKMRRDKILKLMERLDSTYASLKKASLDQSTSAEERAKAVEELDRREQLLAPTYKQIALLYADLHEYVLVFAKCSAYADFLTVALVAWRRRVVHAPQHGRTPAASSTGRRALVSRRLLRLRN